MTTHRKYCTEDFVLHDVMRQPPAVIYMVAVVGFIVAGLMYVFLLQPLIYRGGLPICFGVMILVMMMLLKIQRRSVVLYLDDRSLFIDGKRYLSNEIESLITYDYEASERTLVYLRLKLHNGKRIYLADTNLFERRDAEKSLLLKRLLKSMRQRLSFEVAGGDSRAGRVRFIAKQKAEV